MRLSILQYGNCVLFFYLGQGSFLYFQRGLKGFPPSSPIQALPSSFPSPKGDGTSLQILHVKSTELLEITITLQILRLTLRAAIMRKTLKASKNVDQANRDLEREFLCFQKF